MKKVNGKRYLERGIVIHVAGGGLGQLQQWRRIAEDLGVEIRFNAPVTAIHGQDDDRGQISLGGA